MRCNYTVYNMSSLLTLSFCWKKHTFSEMKCNYMYIVHNICKSLLILSFCWQNTFPKWETTILFTAYLVISDTFFMLTKPLPQMRHNYIAYNKSHHCGHFLYTNKTLSPNEMSPEQLSNNTGSCWLYSCTVSLIWHALLAFICFCSKTIWGWVPVWPNKGGEINSKDFAIHSRMATVKLVIFNQFMLFKCSGFHWTTYWIQLYL